MILPALDSELSRLRPRAIKDAEPGVQRNPNLGGELRRNINDGGFVDKGLPQVGGPMAQVSACCAGRAISLYNVWLKLTAVYGKWITAAA